MVGGQSSHIPLKVKAQATVTGGFGYHRPRRGLLRDHHHVTVRFKDGAVQLPQKVNGFQVFAATVLVGPVMGAVVIQEQHGTNRIHS